MQDNDKKNEEVILLDYDQYFMSNRERFFYVILCAIAIFAGGYIFYQNITISLLITPLALLYPKIRVKELIEKQKSELNYQFKDMLYSISSSLSAGKSIEVAFKDVLKDMDILYPNKDTFIIKETEVIIRRLEMNETVENALSDFAKRSHLEDVESFVDVFITCKRMGGNIVEIIRNTSNVISDKIEIKHEIETLLSARKFEQKVLNVMPIGMVLLLTLSASDYMQPIFTTIQGKIATTFAIAFLVLAFFVSKKIMTIKI